jgi:pimeloyl-ACP methyl ester carboxylesterase
MFFTTTDGLSLHFEDDGQGPPLLCLPGLTRNLADFDDLIAARPRAARWIRLTSRGRHGSDFDPDWSHYSIAQEALDAFGLIEHLGLKKVAIIGTSRGGLLAMALSAFALDRISGVFFNDIGPVMEKTYTDRILDHLGRNPVWPNLEAAATGIAEFFFPAFSNVPPAQWRRAVGRWWIEGPEGLTINYDPKLRTAFEAAMALPPVDAWPMFDRLSTLPFATLRAANSGLISKDSFAEMKRRSPAMLAAEVPDRGHVPFLDEPESLALFDAFVSRLPA